MKPIIQRASAMSSTFGPWLQGAVLLFLRITIGYRFIMTGKGKLANFDRTTGFFESLDIPAPAFHAGLVGSIEMIGEH
jgi:putative oxidoreductase